MNHFSTTALMRFNHFTLFIKSGLRLHFCCQCLTPPPHPFHLLRPPYPVVIQDQKLTTHMHALTRKQIRNTQNISRTDTQNTTCEFSNLLVTVIRFQVNISWKSFIFPLQSIEGIRVKGGVLEFTSNMLTTL